MIKSGVLLVALRDKLQFQRTPWRQKAQPQQRAKSYVTSGRKHAYIVDSRYLYRLTMRGANVSVQNHVLLPILKRKHFNAKLKFALD